MLQKTLPLFSPYIEKIESCLAEHISEMGPQTVLRDACEYAVLSGGKRLRPLLTLFVGECFGPMERVLSAAIAVEWFHAASLIADDLPSMDNDLLRRGKPSVHALFGEATAILASYCCISEGYRFLHKNYSPTQNEEAFFKALEFTIYSSGVRGAPSGQYFDLLGTKERCGPSLEREGEKKTAPLFSMAALYGFLFGGGDAKFSDQVIAMGWELGNAFQWVDDLLDREEDGQGGGQEGDREEKTLQQIGSALTSARGAQDALKMRGKNLDALFSLITEPLHSRFGARDLGRFFS